MNNLETIIGDFRLEARSAVDITALDKLKEISGKLTLNLGKLNHGDYLQNLTTVKSIEIENTGVSEFKLFPELLFVEALSIEQKKGLIEVDLNNLEQAGSLRFEDCRDLVNISGLSKIKELGYFSLQNSTVNLNIEDAFDQLKKITSFSIYNSTITSKITFKKSLFPELHTARSLSMYLINELVIPDDQGWALFPKLENADGVQLAFVGIEKADKDLSTKLFPKLKQISHGITLVGNNHWLEDLNFLEQVELGLNSEIIIHTNAALNTCKNDKLCESLDKHEGKLVLENNGGTDSQCNDPVALRKYCANATGILNAGKSDSGEASQLNEFKVISQLGYLKRIENPKSYREEETEANILLEIKNMSLSKDQKYMATISKDGILKIWDNDSRRLINTITQQFAMYQSQYTQGKHRARYEGFEKLKVDFQSGIYDVYLVDEDISEPVFSEDGRQVAVKGVESFYVYNIADGERIAVQDTPPFGPYKESLTTDNMHFLKRIPLFAPYTSSSFKQTIYDKGRIITASNKQVSVMSINPDQGYSMNLPLSKPIVYLSRKEYLIGVSTIDSTRLELWDLSSISPTLRTTFEGHTQKITCLDISPDSLFMATGSADKNVLVWNTVNTSSTENPIEEIEIHDYPVVEVKFKNYRSYIKSTGVPAIDGKAYFEDELEIIETDFYSPREKEEELDLEPDYGMRDPERHYMQDHNYFYKKLDASTVEIFTHYNEEGERMANREVRNLGRLYINLGNQNVSMEISPKGNYIVVNSTVYKKHTRIRNTLAMRRAVITWQESGMLPGDKEVVFSPDEAFIVAKTRQISFSQRGVKPKADIYKFEAYPNNPEKGMFTKIYSVPVNSNRVNDFIFSENSRFLLMIEPEIITFWNINRREVSFYLLPDEASNNYAYVYSDGAYMYNNNPEILKRLAIREGTSVFAIRQFDPWLNRPDRILERTHLNLFGALNSDVQQEIAAIQKAVKIRTQHLPANFSLNNTPQVRIVDLVKKPVDKKEMQLTVTAKSDQELVVLNIWINGVLVVKDEQIKDASKNGSYYKEYKLELSAGRNNIEVSVKDIKGVESLIQTGIVDCEVKVKPNLYFIGLGVAEYENPIFNISNPDNDVKDLAKILKGKGSKIYNKVYINTLVNEELTLENVMRLKQQLEKSKVDDVVFLYWAGHGELDNDSKQLHLLPYDVDKQNVISSAIPFSVMNDLMTEIPARKKLLILNACHSGEYNEDAVALRKMKTMFLDFRRNNGCTVIASSGADRASITTKKSSNTLLGSALKSIFDNSILSKKGIDLRPDKSQDSFVSVVELITFLQETMQLKLFVPKHLKSQLNPPVPELRASNVDQVFNIWRY